MLSGIVAYMNWRAPTDAELPPSGVVTMILTVPLPGGVVALIVVSSTTVNAVAAAPPNRTWVVPVKPDPVSVTGVPPALGPLRGRQDETVGTSA